MPFRKKALYYGLTLLLLLLALEGMARIAYYAAYGQEYGNGRSAGPLNTYPPIILLSEQAPGGCGIPFTAIPAVCPTTP